LPSRGGENAHQPDGRQAALRIRSLDAPSFVLPDHPFSGGDFIAGRRPSSGLAVVAPVVRAAQRARSIRIRSSVFTMAPHRVALRRDARLSVTAAICGPVVISISRPAANHVRFSPSESGDFLIVQTITA
jgi:hypothetical protein